MCEYSNPKLNEALGTSIGIMRWQENKMNLLINEIKKEQKEKEEMRKKILEMSLELEYWRKR